MNLHSGLPFWSLRNGVADPAPPLRDALQCDVIVVGAGITGALIGDRLSAEGFRVALIDKREPGAGSTLASTALLQYEIDTPLTELMALRGDDTGVRAYQACLRAVVQLHDLAMALDADVGYHQRPSLYLASDLDAVTELHAEFLTRQRYGLPCRWLESADVRQVCSFDAPAAIWTEAAAEIDPWCMTQALLRRARTRGAQVFGATQALEVEESAGGVVVRTEHAQLAAAHVVYACGYEAEKFLRKPVATLHGSFALVSEPVDAFTGWPQRCLIWESARPYLYARTTDDGRALFGGEDVALEAPAIRDALLQPRIAKLLSRARDMFPAIDLRLGCAWAGTFAETEDGLAYIGNEPGASDRCHFALGYGGNGITFSVIAADIIAARLLGHTHADAELFAFDR